MGKQSVLLLLHFFCYRKNLFYGLLVIQRDLGDTGFFYSNGQFSKPKHKPTLCQRNNIQTNYTLTGKEGMLRGVYLRKPVKCIKVPLDRAE